MWGVETAVTCIGHDDECHDLTLSQTREDLADLLGLRDETEDEDLLVPSRCPPRWASLRCERSISLQASSTPTTCARSLGRKTWTGSASGARSASVDWTNNISEQGAKAAKRHQAVSGYWQTHATLQRWCRFRSYLDSALAHGLTALEATTRAADGNPWLPPLTAAAPTTA